MLMPQVWLPEFGTGALEYALSLLPEAVGERRDGGKILATTIATVPAIIAGAQMIIGASQTTVLGLRQDEGLISYLR
jgi:hypothetical protein